MRVALLFPDMLGNVNSCSVTYQTRAVYSTRIICDSQGCLGRRSVSLITNP